MKGAIQKHHGYIFATGGDSFSAAFARPMQAVDAALEAQQTLAAEDWGELGALRVGMAIHTGIADEREGDYFGPPVNRTGRILTLARGGDVLISQTTLDLLRHHLQAAGVTTTDLGQRRLKGIGIPERIHELDLGAEPPRRPSKRRALIAGLLAAGAIVAIVVVPQQSSTTTTATNDSTTLPENASVPDPVGVPVWEESLGAPSSGLAIDGDVVYVATAEGILRAMDIESGDELWRFDALGPIDHPPLVSGGVVYVTTRAGYRLFGLSLSGEERLRCSFGFLEPGPPTVVNRTIMLGAGGSGFLYEVDISAGTQCEPRPDEYPLTGLQQITTAPVAADGDLYLGDARGDVLAVRSDDPNQKAWPNRYFTGAGTVANEYDGRVESLTALEVTRVEATGQRTEVTLFITDAEGFLHIVNGKDGTRRSDPVLINGTPAVVDKLVYYLEPGWLVALDPDLDEKRLEIPEDQPSVGPVIDNGVGFYGTENGTVIAVALDSGNVIMRAANEGPAEFLAVSGRLVVVVDGAGSIRVVEVPSP